MNIFKGTRDEIAVRCEAVLLQDDGKELRVPFNARFRKLKTSEAEELLQRMESSETTKNQIITDHLVRWEKMPHADGGEVEFSAEVLSQALEEIEYREALFRGFLESQFGRRVLRAKN